MRTESGFDGVGGEDRKFRFPNKERVWWVAERGRGNLP